jgi:hypothetical protein
VPEIASTPRRRIERAMSLSSGKPINQRQEQRSCAYPGCVTRLSRYNPDQCCAVHGGWADEEGGRRARNAV